MFVAIGGPEFAMLLKTPVSKYFRETVGCSMRIVDELIFFVCRSCFGISDLNVFAATTSLSSERTLVRSTRGGNILILRTLFETSQAKFHLSQVIEVSRFSKQNGTSYSIVVSDITSGNNSILVENFDVVIIAHHSLNISTINFPDEIYMSGAKEKYHRITASLFMGEINPKEFSEKCLDESFPLCIHVYQN